MADSDDEQRLVQASPWERLRIYLKFNSRSLAVVSMLMIGTFVASGVTQYNRTHSEPPTVTMLESEYESVIMAIQSSRATFDQLYPALYKDASPEIRTQLDSLRDNLITASSMSILREDLSSLPALPSLIQSARAETQPSAQAETKTEPGPLAPQEYNRPMVLYMFMGVLGCLLFGFFGIYLFSKDKERIIFAQSILQTLVSFILGVVAGMLGTTTTG